MGEWGGSSVHATLCSAAYRPKRAQGATEFLIILAVVLVLVLLAVAYLSTNASGTAPVSSAESEAYWKKIASPLQIHSSSSVFGILCTTTQSGGYQVVLRNSDSENIRLSGVYVSGQSRTFCAAGGTSGAASLSLPGYSERVVNIEISPGANACAYGDRVSAKIDFSYNRSGLQFRQNSTTPLVFSCSNSAPATQG